MKRKRIIDLLIICLFVACLVVAGQTVAQADIEGPQDQPQVKSDPGIGPLAIVDDFTQSYKTAPALVNAGSMMTYTIVAINNGSEIKEDVTLLDVLPDGVEFVPGSCTYNTGTVRACQSPPGAAWVEDLAPGERVTTTFAVEVDAGLDVGDELVNWAYLDWSFYRHPLSCTTAITSVPDFSASYMTGRASVEIGTSAVYTIVVANTGTEPAEQVVLSDTLAVENGDIAPHNLVPDDCTYEDGSGSWGCWDYPGRLWEENFAPGDRITTVLTILVSDGPGALVNKAYLQWGASELGLDFTTNVLGDVYLPIVLSRWPRR